MKDKIFGILQRIGRSFMLPIAILPVAGLFLGIGGSFTNQTMLETYNLTSIMGEGTFIYSFLTVLNDCGNIVFSNLPIIFAIGVAIGMAKAEKEVAALSGAIAFFIMHTAISALITINGSAELMLEGTTTDVVGITSLQMGVFGGIIVGIGVALLHNKFYKIEFPPVVAFFGGTRFVPIISSIVYLFVGILMYFIWPYVQTAIYSVGDLVRNSGYAGTLLYGFMERALIPFGLHHVFYLPFWQTGVGGTAEVNGVLIEGAQNIFFAELAYSGTTQFSVEATRFMSGKFPLMIFGLPGAALAMYKCAKPEKRKVASSLLFSAALTSLLTGITEPLEFTFLFVAPILYVIHSIFAGLAYMLCHVFNVGVGMTFSGGLIDLTLFGIMQGNAKTNWINIVFIGIGYFVVYYFLFSFLIKKFDFKTPGREDDDSEIKLYTKEDFKSKNSSTDGSSDGLSLQIIEGLGGKENISDVDCCATRLRITVFDSNLVKEAILKSTGASGVIKKGNGVQIIYGPRVTVIKSNLENTLKNTPTSSPAPAKVEEKLKETTSKEVSKSTENTIYSPFTGNSMPLKDVNDGVFSEGFLGVGMAVEPTEGKLTAPVDGKVEMVFDTKHAYAISTASGLEVLIHVGIDTVSLEGKPFDVKVKAGDEVKVGDVLAVVDLEQIKKAGLKTITPVIISNVSTPESLIDTSIGSIKNSDKLFKINK